MTCQMRVDGRWARHACPYGVPHRRRPAGCTLAPARLAEVASALRGHLLADTDVRFAVRLTPRAGSDKVDGVVDGVLRAHVAAPAVAGAANQALLRLLADELGVARGAIRLVAGAAGRQKLVVVDGIEADTVVARWPGLRV